jgi:acetyl esterase/lipase
MNVLYPIFETRPFLLGAGLAVLIATASTAVAAEPVDKASKAPGYEGEVPVSTHSNVRYGDHPRNVLDFWQARSGGPAPMVLVIHGGGWMGGSKERLIRFVDPKILLEAGISVAAINYRLMKHVEKVSPPVKAPLDDAARAVQFLRSKAKEWNIDTQRIAAAGGSAGACSGLWLAYHDDLADPDSPDPIARESTRLRCAAVIGAQTSLDPKQMKEWIPNITYGGHAFGKQSFDSFLNDREDLLPWIAEYSPYALASPDDPPVGLFYGDAPAMGEPQKDATHSANFGLGLQKRCKEVGIDCIVVYPGVDAPRFRTPEEFLIKKLR